MKGNKKRAAKARRNKRKTKQPMKQAMKSAMKTVLPQFTADEEAFFSIGDSLALAMPVLDPGLEYEPVLTTTAPWWRRAIAWLTSGAEGRYATPA